METAPSCCLLSHTLQEGVGPADANRLLAAEFVKRGFKVSLCGLNDSSVITSVEQVSDIYRVPLPTLSISQNVPWKERCGILRAYLQKQNLDYVIFRFIPYSLQPKGIVWSATKWLSKALESQKVIMLMDEIWLGESHAGLKHRLIGILQRHGILRLLKGIKPQHVYTNNRFNTNVLRRWGVEARTLRLFGNIPVVPTDDGAWLYHEFEKAQLPITPATRSQWLIIGNFGLFHSDWQPDIFLTRLCNLARKHHRQVCIIGIGSLGAYQSHWHAVAKTWEQEFRFLHLGRRPDFEVSLFLQSVDFGITTNPFYLVGKSGTCMAMLDHGLPIIVPRISEADDLTELPASLLVRCGDEIFAERTRATPEPQLPRAAEELVRAMSVQK